MVEKSQFSNQVRWYSFILCMLIVFIHAQNVDIFIGQHPAVNAVESFVEDKAARIANAGFFLCSGYLFYRDFTMDKLAYKWRRRFFSTVIPFAVWNFFYYVVRLAASTVRVFDGAFQQEVLWNRHEVFQAVVNCKYNPVFWFLQFLIVYIGLCPLIYQLLRNKYIGLCALVSLLLLAGCGLMDSFGDTLPSMANWLFIYMSGGYLGLHGRKWVEASKQTKRPFWFSAAGTAASHLFFAMSPGLTGQLLCCLFDAMLLWNVLGYVRLPEAKWWMRDTFFIYAVHFMIVRAGNKLAYACFGNSMGMGLWMFLLLPAAVVIFCGYLGRFLRQYAPFVWNIISGNR